MESPLFASKTPHRIATGTFILTTLVYSPFPQELTAQNSTEHPVSTPSDQGVGYMPGNAAAASSHFYETPFNFTSNRSIYNEQFLVDTGTNNFYDASQYSIGGDQYHALRNLHTTDVPWDSFNTVGIENFTTPTSLVYGLSRYDFSDDREPKIVSVNISTAKALQENSGRLNLKYDSRDSTRINISNNRSLIQDELAVRVDLLQEEISPTPDYEQSSSRAYLAFDYQPASLNQADAQFNISGNYELGELNYEYSESHNDLDWNLLNITVSNTFNSNTIGYHIDFFKQDYNTKATYYDYDSNRESLRTQGFINIDFKDNESSLLSHLAGSQSLTAFLERRIHNQPQDRDQEWPPKKDGKTKSIGGTWNGAWFNETVSTSVGWRKDETTRLRTNVYYEFPTEHYSWNDQSRHASTRIKVSRILELDKDLPFQLDLGYSRGKVEYPGLETLDPYGNQLENPQGQDEQISLFLSSNDNKWALRLSSVKRTSRDLLDYSGFEDISRIFNFANYTVQQIQDSSTEYHQPSASALAAGYSNQTVYLQEVVVPAWKNIEQELLNNHPDLLTLVGNDYGSSGLQRFQNADTNAWELELTANPTENWRILINASVAGKTDLYHFDNDFFAISSTLKGTIESVAGELSPPNGWDDLKSVVSDVFSHTAFDESESSNSRRTSHLNLVSNFDVTNGFFRNSGIGGALRYQENNDSYYSYQAGSFDETIGKSRAEVDLWLSYKFNAGANVGAVIRLNVYNAFDQGDYMRRISPRGEQLQNELGYPRRWTLSSTFSF